MSTGMPVGDLRLLDAITSRCMETLSSRGEVAPFGVVDVPGGLCVLQTNGLPDRDSRHSLMNAMRLVGYDNHGTRSGLCMEALGVVAGTPEASALLDRLLTEGRSISEHPDVRNVLNIRVESDEGTSCRIIPMTRSEAGINLGAPVDSHLPAGSPVEGDLSGYHVTGEMRMDSRFVGYMGLVRMMTPGSQGAQKAN